MATNERARWLAQFGMDSRGAMRLERALCTLADFEGPVKDAMAKQGHRVDGLHDVCDGLRLIVDGED